MNSQLVQIKIASHMFTHNYSWLTKAYVHDITLPLLEEGYLSQCK